MESIQPIPQPSTPKTIPHRLNGIFCVFFALTFGYYSAFFLFTLVPRQAGFDIFPLIIAPFILAGSIILTGIYYAILRTVQKKLSNHPLGASCFFGAGVASILYCLFAILIFPLIGQVFSGQLVASSTVEVGDKLNIEFEPSAGFYTRSLTMPIIVTRPDGSVISNPQNNLFFEANITNPNCHILFTLFYCKPQSIKELLIASTDTYPHDPQIDQVGKYTVSVPNNSIKSASILATPSALPPIFKNNAVINIPGYSLIDPTNEHNSVQLEGNDLITFDEIYVPNGDPDSVGYRVKRMDASTLGSTKTYQTFLPGTTTTTTIINGNKIFLSRANESVEPGYDFVYWISGPGLIMISGPKPWSDDTVLGKDIFFQTYIKQYPSTL